MDVESLLISKVLHEGNLQEVVDRGVRPMHLSGAWADRYTWILTFFREYGEVPTTRAFLTEFANVSLPDASEEPFARLVDELYENFQHHHLVESIPKAVNLLDTDGPDAAMKLLSETLQRLTTETARLREVDVIETWEARLARYEEWRKKVNVLRGIPTGFNGLDQITGGLRPQQLITFVGEPKKGKSLVALIMAMAVHRHGKRPLFVSFEMSADEQMARHDALAAKVPYERILRGDLTPKELERIAKAQRLARNMHPFIISEDASALTTVGALSGRVQQYRPDVLFVDGVYLMDDELGEPKNSWQALTNITRSLKRLAQRWDIPIVATTQVLASKLQSKTSRAVTADAIGYSSSFAQDSDLVMAVESDPDVEDQSILRVVIARSAPQGKVHIAWDFKRMDFSEVGGGDDDDDRDV